MQRSLTRYYHVDALASTRLVTYYNGGVNVAFSDNYQPYGQDNATSGSETWKFTGKPYASSPGFYYDYHRRYNPSTWRFNPQSFRESALGTFRP